MTTEIVLIRHGQTHWNTEGRYQGTSDTELDELGRRQAAALADAMQGEKWDQMVSSPLARAWFTAVPVAEAVGIAEADIIPDPRLMERAYGVAEGMTLAERETAYPGELWDGLESREMLSERSLETVNDYVARFPNQRIILVTHGTWIASLLTAISNGEYGYDITHPLNTSRTYISHDAEGWHVGDVNLAQHLGSLT